jgi:hypothetical protein
MLHRSPGACPFAAPFIMPLPLVDEPLTGPWPLGSVLFGFAEAAFKIKIPLCERLTQTQSK